jgi:hypothetical protein
MHPRTAELLEFLDGQRRVLLAAFALVPDGAHERRPAPDRWSPAEIIEHLAIVERRINTRLTGLVDQARQNGISAETSTSALLPTLNLQSVEDRSRRVSAPEAAHPTGIGSAAAWTALEAAGAEVRNTLRGADGLDLASVSMPHPALGSMSLYQWFAFVGGHEARHAAQIREIAAALNG